MIATYTYTILSVDKTAKVMEVLYSADGFESMHIGVRLPAIDELLEDVIQAYAPIALWESSLVETQEPIVGISGSLDRIRPSQESMDAEQLRRMEYPIESDPLFFKWMRGEATEQEWKDAVQKVKIKYPDGYVFTAATGSSGSIPLTTV